MTEHFIVTQAREIKAQADPWMPKRWQLDRAYIGAVGDLLKANPDNAIAELQQMTAALEIGLAILDEPEVKVPDEAKPTDLSFMTAPMIDALSRLGKSSHEAGEVA
jgi:single-stranded DNA-specific DHH superfamily exonuclease